jgi:hypothetical protein
MTRLSRVRPIRVGVTFLTVAAAAFGLAFGSAGASNSQASSTLPCNAGGPACIDIGFSDAWLSGETVQLEYSHAFFCAEPPVSAASSNCEAGEGAETAPPSGPVVSEIYVLIPIGFSPASSTVHCGAKCIDQPSTIDLSRIGGAANATLPIRSFVIEEDESFQSTWWPAVVVGVKSLNAWNKIASAKSIEQVDACQASGHCVPEAETNAFIFFQVLGPGMSPGGPD